MKSIWCKTLPRVQFAKIARKVAIRRADGGMGIEFSHLIEGVWTGEVRPKTRWSPVAVQIACTLPARRPQDRTLKWWAVWRDGLMWERLFDDNMKEITTRPAEIPVMDDRPDVVAVYDHARWNLSANNQAEEDEVGAALRALGALAAEVRGEAEREDTLDGLPLFEARGRPWYGPDAPPEEEDR